MIIVDRFEGDFALLEYDGGIIRCERTMLPDLVCEGDVLNYQNGEYTVDKEATNQRRERMTALRNRVLKRDI